MKFGKTTRVAGLALALAAGAMAVVGVAPASAATTYYWITSPNHYSRPPGFDVLIRDTQSRADQRCVATYGLRARGTTPHYWVGDADPGGDWQVYWSCDSN